jgi:ATP-dependent 26S proteasome regulatory subunit
MYLQSQTLTQGVKALETLVQSYHPMIAIETMEEERATKLLQAVAESVGMQLMEWSVTRGLSRAHVPGANRWANEFAPPGTQTPGSHADTTDPEKLLTTLQENSAKAIYLLKDFTQHLENPTIVRQLREVAQQFSQNRSVIVLIGHALEFPAQIKQDVVYYDLGLPGPDELEQAINEAVKTLRVQNRVAINVHEADIRRLVTALTGMTLKQARQVICHAALEDGELCVNDVQQILDRKAQVIRNDGILDFFPANDHAPQLGGFKGLKQWLTEASVGFSPRAKAMNLPAPKGILIVGVQGCGKSLAAKTIAQAWKMPLLKLDAGRLYNKYIGESEQNFRRAIALAESMAPTILWIDEIEKSFSPNAGDSDGGLSQRLFGSFLTWMQEKSQSVFVIATANDISKLPPELLRKGRFDEIFFVDLPDATERQQILQIHLQKHQQSPVQFDFVQLLEVTEGFSGAEIEQAIITALYRSLYRQQPLDTALLTETIQSTVPLSIARRADVEHLRTIAKSSFVSVR